MAVAPTRLHLASWSLQVEPTLTGGAWSLHLQAVELATKLARKRAQPGDGDAALTSLAQLGAEIEVAFYLEAIWPGEQPSRQVRWAEANLPATLRGTCAQPATLTIQPATSRMQPATPCAQPTCLPMQPATRCAQVRRGEADQPAGTEGAGVEGPELDHDKISHDIKVMCNHVIFFQVM